MNGSTPSFFARLRLAFGAFFRIIADPSVAIRAEQLGASRPIATPPAAPSFEKALPDAALQLLGLLQQEGRFIDFLEEDVASFADADVGAAARVVHAGCRKVVHDLFTIVPVRNEPEGSRITLQAGFDPSSIRLTGNVVGKPPFSGSLVHRGWRATHVRLPQVAAGHDTKILASAEVEL